MPLALDSNLALLLFVGLSGEENIKKNKRLQAFDVDDFRMLLDIVDRSDRLVLCPNVASETSNLIFYMQGPARHLALNFLKTSLDNFDEIYVPSMQAMRRVEAPRIGVTDCVLLELIEQGCELLTVDLDLYIAASKLSHEAVNFNHLRDRRADIG